MGALSDWVRLRGPGVICVKLLLHTAGFMLGRYRASLNLIKETQSLGSRCFSPLGVPPKDATEEANWQVAKHKKELRKTEGTVGVKQDVPNKSQRRLQR